MSLPGISKHLKVLERGGLISRGRDAQFRPCHLEVEALDSALDWIGAQPPHVGRALRQARRAAGRHPADARADGVTEGKGDEAVSEHGSSAAPNELRFSRVFDAPRELVFRCMTDPDHLTHFWGPKGVSTPRDRITVDARPGGAFETVMVNDSDGNEYATRAVYDEVRPPERLSGPRCTPACG